MYFNIKEIGVMKKSEKKKTLKKEDSVMHQHKNFVGGVVHVFGFPHPIGCKHNNKKTQMVHDITIKIDSGNMGALRYGNKK